MEEHEVITSKSQVVVYHQAEGFVTGKEQGRGFFWSTGNVLVLSGCMNVH